MQARADARRRSPLLLFPVPLLIGLLLSASAHSGKLSDIEYVIHVSVDGVNSTRLASYLSTYGATTFSNWKRFVDEGATTLNARTAYGWTDTSPNHATMLTSMPVDPPSGSPDSSAHFYSYNGEPDPYPFTIHSNHPDNIPPPITLYISSVWDVAHDYGLSTSHFSSKTKFVIFEQTWEDGGGPDAAPGVAGDNGTDKVDYTAITVSNDTFGNGLDDAYDMNQDFLAQMAANHYDYAFIHYVDPDKGGHASGWSSTLYRETLEQVDGYLGELLNLVETDATLMGKTAIVLVADHGGGGISGTGTAHNTATAPPNYTIPFFAWGPGVEAGADLYTLNAGVRADPGTGRPDYNASPQPIRNGDAGNLATQLLGLPAIPGSWSNASQDLVLGSCVVDADCDDVNACTDDVCDQGECSNTYASAATVCRTGSGDMCDPDETCTGTSDVCPTDTVTSSGTVCNAGSGDLCDPDEVCSGTAGQACPADTIEPDTTVCRTGSGDLCDPDELCTGVADAACPVDAFEAPGTFCGNPGDGLCDLQDQCDGVGVCENLVYPPTTVCRTDAGECDVEELCDGIGNCPVDAFEVSGTFCGNPGDGLCDLQDTCDGGGVCDNNVEPPTTVCRADAGECDVEELCDGAGACPVDAFEVSGTFCGTPRQGVCDIQDKCDGAGVCEDLVHPPTTVCRTDAGPCDVEELCDGAGNCPADVVEPDTTECRGAVDLCDIAEMCTGIDPECPTDMVVDCADGDVCNGDEVCVDGDCTAGTPLDCDDFDSCTADSCDEISGCEHTWICGTEVPATPGWGQALLVTLLAVAGALLIDRRRRSAT